MKTYYCSVAQNTRTQVILNTLYIGYKISWLIIMVKQLLLCLMLGYAALLMKYEKTVQNALSDLRMNIVSVHHGKQHRDIIEQADVIAIGGGEYIFVC